MPSPQPPLRQLCPLSEAATLLGVSRSGLYRLLADGLIVARKAGKRTLVPASELDRFATSLPAAQIGGPEAAR